MRSIVDIFSRSRGSEGTAVVANLGESNKMYYNEEMKRWVLKGNEAEAMEEIKRLQQPPPVKTDSAKRAPSSLFTEKPVVGQKAADLLCMVPNLHQRYASAMGKPRPVSVTSPYQVPAPGSTEHSAVFSKGSFQQDQHFYTEAYNHEDNVEKRKKEGNDEEPFQATNKESLDLETENVEVEITSQRVPKDNFQAEQLQGRSNQISESASQNNDYYNNFEIQGQNMAISSRKRYPERSVELKKLPRDHAELANESRFAFESEISCSQHPGCPATEKSSNSTLANRTMQSVPEQLQPIPTAPSMPQLSTERYSNQHSSMKPPSIEEPSVRLPSSHKPLGQKPFMNQSTVRQQVIHQAPIKHQEIHQTPIKHQEIYPAPIKDQEIHQDPITDQGIHQPSIKDQEIHQDPITDQGIHQDPITDQGIHQDPITDQGIQQPSIKDQETYQDPITDQEIHQPSIKDQEIHQASIQDQETYQASIKDQEIHQASIKDQETYQASIKDQELHQASIKDQELHQDPIKDQETYQASIKDQELHEASIKDQEIHQAPIKQGFRQASMQGVIKTVPRTCVSQMSSSKRPLTTTQRLFEEQLAWQQCSMQPSKMEQYTVRPSGTEAFFTKQTIKLPSTVHMDSSDCSSADISNVSSTNIAFSEDNQKLNCISPKANQRKPAERKAFATGISETCFKGPCMVPYKKIGPDFEAIQCLGKPDVTFAKDSKGPVSIAQIIEVSSHDNETLFDETTINEKKISAPEDYFDEPEKHVLKMQEDLISFIDKFEETLVHLEKAKHVELLGPSECNNLVKILKNTDKVLDESPMFQDKKLFSQIEEATSFISDEYQKEINLLERKTKESQSTIDIASIDGVMSHLEDMTTSISLTVSQLEESQSNEETHAPIEQMVVEILNVVASNQEKYRLEIENTVGEKRKIENRLAEAQGEISRLNCQVIEQQRLSKVMMRKHVNDIEKNYEKKIMDIEQEFMMEQHKMQEKLHEEHSSVMELMSNVKKLYAQEKEASRELHQNLHHMRIRLQKSENESILKMQVKDAEIRCLHNSNHTLECNLEDSLTKLEIMKRESDNAVMGLQDQINSLLSERSSLRNNLARVSSQAKDDLEKLYNEKESLESKLFAAEKSITLNVELAEKEKLLKENAEKSYEDLKRNFEDYKISAERKVEQLNAEIASRHVEAQKSSLEKKVMETLIREKEEQMVMLDKKVNELSNELVVKLMECCKACEKTKEEAELRETMALKIQKLNCHQDDLCTKIKDLEQKNIALQRDNEKLRKWAEEREQYHEQITQNANQIFKETEAALEEEQARVADLTASLCALNSQYGELRKEKEVSESHISELMGQLDCQVKSIELLEKKIEDQKIQITDMTERITKAERDSAKWQLGREREGNGCEELLDKDTAIIQCRKIQEGLQEEGNTTLVSQLNETRMILQKEMQDREIIEQKFKDSDFIVKHMMEKWDRLQLKYPEIAKDIDQSTEVTGSESQSLELS